MFPRVKLGADSKYEIKKGVNGGGGVRGLKIEFLELTPSCYISHQIKAFLTLILKIYNIVG